ncbi:MAG: ABC transporter ATP-binding protein [Clostridiales bacterium]|uniref:ATP-binding cassette domain-containing protein n=1 Tax=Provencibacterium massiliense TaxID=1841868 RepID=UPI0009A6108C|nr:ATP-binding cassette domain-containing protein [Provencibacterium massiliense]PWM34339.1 MAG: ABC transporter ATP-binding protein [Clostridiales bacterium]RGB66305.1 ABC transporter ATP-binding protein [Harryflintia acetispora]
MAITVTGLSKSFGGRPVLRDFSARFEEGSVSCIFGPSGQGKTTLLHLLMGLLAPDGGAIEGIGDQRIGAVFQEDRLCETLSVLRNIRLVCRKGVPDEEILTHLQEVGLRDSAYKPAGELSGGMKRRVALVRAVIVRPDVLLLDEPFKGMDAATKADAIGYLRRRAPKATVLLVTHDREDAGQLGAAQIIELDA